MIHQIIGALLDLCSLMQPSKQVENWLKPDSKFTRKFISSGALTAFQSKCCSPSLASVNVCQRRSRMLYEPKVCLANCSLELLQAVDGLDPEVDEDALFMCRQFANSGSFRLLDCLNLRIGKRNLGRKETAYALKFAIQTC